MRLKQVSIENFKSYKARTAVQLEDGKTFFVGPNGSGKSNFFQALNFVLGTRNAVFSQLGRMHFFHNGRDDLKVTVEVVLEDEEGKVSGDVTISRRMGVRTDCFFLCGSRITRKELSYLLECCGFSLTAPYYILTHSLMRVLVFPNPKNRLKAFVECFGLCISRTTAFLNEMLTSMAEMRTFIDEFRAILDRFSQKEVDVAAAKLREHKKLIKERAVLKIQLYSVSLAKYENRLIEESEAASRKKERIHSYASELHDLKCQITTAKESLEKSKNDLATSQLLLSDLETERETLLRNKARLSLKIKDAEEEISVEEGNISREDPDSSRSDSTLALSKKTELEKRFEELYSKAEREKNEVEALGRQLNEKKQAHHDLLLKRAYRDKFSTIEEMKEWIHNEARKLEKKYEENLATIKSCDFKMKDCKKAIDTCEGEIKRFDQASKTLRAVLKEQSGIKHRISELHNELNELHRMENSTMNELASLMKTLTCRKNELVLKVGKAAFNGFESVRKVIASMDSSECDGWYGAILQNFACDPSLNLAVDAAAGSRLLSQIVSTDVMGTAIIRKFNSLDLPGEVGFFPLNRIIPPQILSSPREDAVPLINHIQFPESVRNVMLYLFGRVMLCRDLEVAAQVARELGCSCVTLDGDRVNSAGPLFGGFIDPKRSTRALFAEFESIESSQRNKIASLDRIRLEIDEKKLAIDAAMSEIQQVQMKIRTSESSSYRRILTEKFDYLKGEEKHWAEQLKQLHSDNQVLLRNRQALLQSGQDTEGESSGAGGTAGRIEVVEKLNKEIFELTKAVNKRSASLSALECQLYSMAREVACTKEVFALKATDVEKVKILRQKLADLKTRDQIARTHLVAVEEKITVTLTNVNAKKLKVQKLESELEELKKKFRQADEPGGGSNDVSVVQEKIMNIEQKIAEIKQLRDQEMDFHKIKTISAPVRLSVQEIREQLKRLNEAIDVMESTPLMSAVSIKKQKKFLRVKESAIVGEQEYSSFCVSVKDVLPWVQQYIRGSLENIAGLYNHYFSMMVEDGHGSMTLEPSSNEEENAVPFTGIKIISNFSGGISQMRLLSEGQRVVVLLSIVFAFMKSQNVAFCIMDEIDRALSGSCIRGMLQAMSELEPRQFLISSHKNTMVSIGDHFFLLKFKKSSSIKPATRSEAMQLLESLPTPSRKPSTSLITSTSSQQSESSELSSYSTSTY